jgi:hypothetical protein
MNKVLQVLGLRTGAHCEDFYWSWALGPVLIVRTVIHMSFDIIISSRIPELLRGRRE